MNVTKDFVRYDLSSGLFYWIKSGLLAKSISTSGYRVVKVKGKSYRQHRLAWYFHYGELPEHGIDHINGNKLDNRIENLRDISQGENCKNRKTNKNNSSGFRGVYKTKYGFISRIGVNGVIVNLGTFNSFDDAMAKRLSAEVDFGFHDNAGRCK